MRLALFEPDIPQNAGTLMRFSACMNVAVDLIEPCGFVLDDRRFRRSAMDYLDRLVLSRHLSWQAYYDSAPERDGRLILLTTKAETVYTDFLFQSGDTLLVGREGAGVPDAVHVAADERLRVPMANKMRSLNVAVAAAMVLGEALRQTGGFAEGQ
jgi:tRNA (cytidine/uridine-2'-O-)-methyltransferase